MGPVPLFQVDGYGRTEALGPGHIAGWNSIAHDPDVQRQLSLKTVSQEFLDAALLRRTSDWQAAVRDSAGEHKELVVLDGGGTVVAALELAFYSCDSGGQDFGVSVDIAVTPTMRNRGASNIQGLGLGASTLKGLASWVAAEVPGSHIFADVCTDNLPSTAMMQRVGWHPVDQDGPCNLWAGGSHQCSRIAKRWCAHPSHQV